MNICLKYDVNPDSYFFKNICNLMYEFHTILHRGCREQKEGKSATATSEVQQIPNHPPANIPNQQERMILIRLNGQFSVVV